MINPFKKTYTTKDQNFFKFLSKIRLFGQLTYDEMALFEPFFYLRTYNAEEVVFFRNDPSNALYVVKSGKISLAIDLKEDFEHLITLRSGQSFGENSLLKQTTRVYNALVISDRAELYVLPRVNLEEILESHSKIKAKMLESLAFHYNELNTNLVKTYKSSYGFFNLAQIFGE
ncbi:MAG: Crp/Fnr family transcriptional regulator [Cyclobacteriaceae bacterium]